MSTKNILLLAVFGFGVYHLTRKSSGPIIPPGTVIPTATVTPVQETIPETAPPVQETGTPPFVPLSQPLGNTTFFDEPSAIGTAFQSDRGYTNLYIRRANRVV